VDIFENLYLPQQMAEKENNKIICRVRIKVFSAL